MSESVGAPPGPESIPFPTSDPAINNQCHLPPEDNISLTSPLYCRLFADPHLLTFGGRMQTCAMIGAWPLVDNVYYTIQALNVPIEQDTGGINDSSISGSNPSAITRVSQLFQIECFKFIILVLLFFLLLIII